MCGGLEHQLAADGEPQSSDAGIIDVVSRLEIVDGGEDVVLTGPSEHVRVAVARSLSAFLEDECAVAVGGEHPNAAGNVIPRAARKHDDCGAVPARGRTTLRGSSRRGFAT